MSDAARLTAFSNTYLGGRSIPPDLAILLKMQWERVPDAGGDSYVDPLEMIDFRFWTAGRSSALIDMSYLSTQDRADPNIMANVAATEDVFVHILFVGEHVDGGAYGYWLGPENRPLETAPIVRYDTEGQFTLPPGRTLIEALLFDWGSSDQEQFQGLRDWFNDFGLGITASTKRDFPSPTLKPTPDDLHTERYNMRRAAAGLPPAVR